MKANEVERMRAERLSAAVDQLIGDPEAQAPIVDTADAGVLSTAQKLARLPSLLGPVEPALEQRVMRQVQARAALTLPRRKLRVAWAMAGLAAILLAVMALTPLGQTAVASFMAVFNLGRTEVRITPVDTPSARTPTAVAENRTIERYPTLEEAQAQIPFALPQPAFLPAGYRLNGVNSYIYPDLPTWILQPLFAELVYQDTAGDEFVLRVYPITLGDEASISGLNLQAAPIQDVQDVDVTGQPGVLLRLGSERAETAWKEVVWEHRDVVLALSAIDLTEAELLDIARSVR
jgi:hypothetical protein